MELNYDRFVDGRWLKEMCAARIFMVMKSSGCTSRKRAGRKWKPRTQHDRRVPSSCRRNGSGSMHNASSQRKMSHASKTAQT